MKRLMTTLLLVLLGWTGLCFAEGVTVSGKVTFTDLSGNTQEYGATGTVALLNTDGTTVKSAQLETTEDNRYPHYSITDVAAGTYTLSFEGEGYGNIIKYSESDFVVESTDIAKDITATVDNTVGYVTLTIKYGEWQDWGGGYGQWTNTKSIPGATVTCTPKNSGDPLSGSSDESGNVKFLLAKNADLTYTIKVTASTYKDTTFDMAAFTANEYAPGGFVANSLTVYMQEIPLPAVTVSGTITKPDGMPTGLKLQMTTIKKALDPIDLGESYSIPSVPVGDGKTKIALYDPTNYYNNYRAENYAITVPENGEFTVTGEDGGTFTQNLTIAKVAANVTGSVTNYSSLRQTLTIKLTGEGENPLTYSTQNLDYSTGAFTIQGVKPGTYTVSATVTGFKLKGENAPTVTVTDALADAAIGELELEEADVEFTFAAQLSVYNNSTYQTIYLAGAIVELFAADADITTAEPLGHTEADAQGNFTLTQTGRLGTSYILTVSHPNVKFAQQTITCSDAKPYVYFNFEYVATETDPVQRIGVKDLSYTLLTDTTLTLSWNWPAAWNTEDYEVRNIRLSRRLSSAASTDNVFLAGWSGSDLTYDAPCTLKDTVPEKGKMYTYSFEINYTKPSGVFDTSFTVDLRPDYTLTYTVNNAALGTVRAFSDYNYEQAIASGVKLKEGNLFYLIATAAEDCRFKGWKEAGQDTMLSKRDTVNLSMPAKDYDLRAVFEKYVFTVAVAADDEAHGTVTGGKKYELGQEASVKAEAKAGWVFVAWKEGETTVSTLPTYTFKVEKDVTLTAVFEAQTYVLSLSVNETGWGEVEGANEYKAGTEVTAKAKANEGYKFVAWMEGDQEVSTEATYTFTMPEKDVTLMAVFAEEQVYYTLTLTANDEAFGTVTGSGRFVAESEVIITATPNKGYHFVAWMEGETEVSKEAVHTYKVEKDVTLTAVFAEGTANEGLEAARAWRIYAENGTLVIKGVAGDRYTVYDMAGRLAGQAQGTGADIRMDVAPNKLYIVRRMAADGSFDTKKIVVR